MATSTGTTATVTRATSTLPLAIITTAQSSSSGTVPPCNQRWRGWQLSAAVSSSQMPKRPSAAIASSGRRTRRALNDVRLNCTGTILAQTMPLCFLGLRWLIPPSSGTSQRGRRSSARITTADMNAHTWPRATHLEVSSPSFLSQRACIAPLKSRFPTHAWQ